MEWKLEVGSEYITPRNGWGWGGMWTKSLLWVTEKRVGGWFCVVMTHEDDFGYIYIYIYI